MATNDKRALRVTVLLHEHSMIRNEVIAMIGHYKSHTRVLQLVVTAVVAVVAWWITLPADKPTMIDTDLNAWRAAVGGALLIPILCSYLVMDVLHDLYSLTLLGARTSRLEEQIAEIAGPNLMMWERIASVFFSKFKSGGVFNPAYFHSALAGLTALFLMVGFPLLVYLVLWFSPMRLKILYAEEWFVFCILFCVVVVVLCVVYYWHVLVQMRGLAEHWIGQEARNAIPATFQTPQSRQWTLRRTGKISI